MPVEVDNSSAMTVSTASGEASPSSSGNQVQPSSTTTATTMKRKRNLPGMPDPDAEVIALSPKTLMATNRFVCEICNKGFQRDQNLQLHRRGHNLPWKLRQRANKEIRKRVYVCPEPSCVHHNPARALGDLTGIKKHFCRKHGEKKWKCEKCSKKYAVQSDWKAHLKTCGTKEYRCDCGTLFSRRDSFVTHRAFCDALAEESSRAQTSAKSKDEPRRKKHAVLPSPPSPSVVVSMAPLVQDSELPKNVVGSLHYHLPTACLDGSSSTSGTGSSRLSSVFDSRLGGSLLPQTSAFSDLVCAASLASTPAIEPPLLHLSPCSGFTLFGTTGQDGSQFARPSQPAMSATALLQKAAEMGAAASNPSLLRGLGLSIASSSCLQENSGWNRDNEGNTASAGSGLTHPSDGAVGLTELMIGPSLLFGSKSATHDFLGLKIGMGGGVTPTGGVSALMSSMGSGGGDADLPVAEGDSEVKTD
ncbi:Zinc finger protein enhydrous [Thalictrum thalictroides]|uniref:Zinc finger protein enhydrous n=1 Tax=Thalictrum thalictroides TaxID=46969 RepID=A0A7J6WR28_THATH|nr:Zinc finger protein enhydrous [Thalictrum thalictroides]